MSVASLTTLLTVYFLAGSGSEQISKNVEPGVAADAADVQVSQEWLTSYEDAKALATKHKLPLLLHFDATWCGACRVMEAEVMHKPAVTEQLGRTLIGVRIDADRYKDLITEYGISTLPTELIVQPDGKRSELFVGAVSLSKYKLRLQQFASSAATALAKSDAESAAGEKDAAEVRSCLIVRHDGKMVGAGGFSPVALVAQRRWIKGSDKFVATHEGVQYFLQSQQEVDQFTANPTRYIPLLHGLDLVELHLENRTTTGAIEYGAFYKGQVYFFASVKNRDRFENNPTWYLSAMADARSADSKAYPFLNANTVN